MQRWVIDRLNKLIWPFLWGSKIDTVGRHTLFCHARDGGLGLVRLGFWQLKLYAWLACFVLLMTHHLRDFTSLRISAAAGFLACALSGLLCATTAVRTRFFLPVSFSVLLLLSLFVFLVISFFLLSPSMRSRGRSVPLLLPYIIIGRVSLLLPFQWSRIRGWCRVLLPELLRTISFGWLHWRLLSAW